MKEQKEKKGFLSAPALAERLDVSRGQVYKLSAAGKLPDPVKIGSLMRWSIEQVDKWVMEGRAA